mmetsp:Transcript_98422/g.170485  ORF Transcript_98422/g.170485 Transcript_98422/m.170485 type:complete len:280 (+) Transcript_98422:27-866(+)
MSSSLSFLDVCCTNGLDLFSCLGGTETKKLQRSCSALVSDLAQDTLLSKLALCGCRASGTPTLQETLESNRSLSRGQAYDAAYNHARSLGCTMKTALSTPDKDGRMPLYIATKASRHVAMEVLLHLGAHVDSGSITNGWSPLLLASLRCDARAVAILVAHRADVNCCSARGGFTPLAAASATCCHKTCTRLLDAGASAAFAERMMTDAQSHSSEAVLEFLRGVLVARDAQLQNASCLMNILHERSLQSVQCSLKCGTIPLMQCMLWFNRFYASVSASVC